MSDERADLRLRSTPSPPVADRPLKRGRSIWVLSLQLFNSTFEHQYLIRGEERKPIQKIKNPLAHKARHGTDL